MKKKRIFMVGLLVMILAFGMTVMGCGGDSGDDEGGGGGGGSGKMITIEGITGKTGNAMIFISYDLWEESVAVGQKSISNNSAAIRLLKYDSLTFWNGSGSYCILLHFEQDDAHTYYIYTNGQTFTGLGITSSSSEANIKSRIPKYTISSAASTIAFSKFRNADELYALVE